MSTLSEYVAAVTNDTKRQKLQELFDWLTSEFPQLQIKFGWGQPMFTDHGTFIIACKHTKKHITVSPEVAGIQKFADKLDTVGYAHTENTFRITWEQEVHYELLREMIQFNIEDKANETKFWRKALN
jgi:uncharacterized protein YdhG (YjbR/CyaY superfamily)